jgi:transcriptional regulator with XRE-family HTH domain
MSVISKKFANELNEKEMRDAYLEEKTRAKLAQQIRSLRLQRNWSQSKLGNLMHKPQSNIARLEDRDIGRYTLSSLFELASAFDVALVVEFVAYDEFLKRTQNLSPGHLQIESFSRQALEPLCSDSTLIQLDDVIGKLSGTIRNLNSALSRWANISNKGGVYLPNIQARPRIIYEQVAGGSFLPINSTDAVLGQSSHTMTIATGSLPMTAISAVAPYGMAWITPSLLDSSLTYPLLPGRNPPTRIFPGDWHVR